MTSLFYLKRFHHRLNTLLSLTTIVSFLLLISVNLKAEVTPEAGEKLFKQNCASCHKIGSKVVGPDLKDVHKKRTEEWLIKWIRNNGALRSEGDADAIAIYNEFKTEMPAFLSFTDDDIKSVVAYIAKASEGTTPVGPSGPVPPEGPAGKPISIWLYAVLVVLIFVFVILLRANRLMKRMVMEKAGEPMPEPLPLGRRLKSPKMLALFGLIIVAILGFTFADSAMRLQHSKNYQPVQPILFPHDLHAGTLQINCLYCHAGAEKSKVAGIPTVNTCMNCHKGIQEGETAAGTEEIKKIYAAYDNNKPIEWVRIHNLPDHVYFNHSQHVAVGKIACQTCHGPVETMKEMKQYSSLSMGWCLNCHRQTGVQFKDNGFYTMFEELHKKVEHDSTYVVTEAMVGGDECQRCHY